VVVLGGIEGRSPFNDAIVRGLDEGGVDWAIELRPWTSRWGGPLYNLRAEKRNRGKAQEIADRIVRYQIAYPGRPVVIVGQSGGAAMAAWVAEAMPPGRQVDAVVMLAVSLSRTYMLDEALRNTRRGIVNFYSPRDLVLVATRVSGTMDGSHGASAGRNGFEVPRTGGRPSAYQRLFQMPWNPQMSHTGHIGVHLTSGTSDFVATYVAPLVLGEQWDSDFISRVYTRRLIGPPSGRATSPLPAPAPSPLASPAPSVAPATAPAPRPVASQTPSPLRLEPEDY